MTRLPTAREALEEAARVCDALAKRFPVIGEATTAIRTLAASLAEQPEGVNVPEGYTYGECYGKPGAVPTVVEIEEFRREHHIPDDGKLEPWAIKENAILNYLCYRAATPLTLPASESKAQPCSAFYCAQRGGRLPAEPAALPEGWLAAYRRLSKEYDALCASEKCVVCGAGAIRLRFDGQTLFHDCMACGTTQAGDVVLRANVALAQSKVPEGWVAVPREPTEAMLLAGMASPGKKWATLTGESIVLRWRAMLAAAPKGNEEEKP